LKYSILEFNHKESISDVLMEMSRDGADELILRAADAVPSECL